MKNKVKAKLILFVVNGWLTDEDVFDVFMT